ncbi:LysR family transcriptional regulator [Lysinibacillus agricola]|uniref:LysR family transcriptional regulator n=1 Tax=Lysinibacillus agricola TaxID=2590012 RepID=A0ABX7AX73_9BACI|nr:MULTISPECIES: LysR family transcriptional regulator [Lysinibacillus]KOS64270.1 transcriptional regulator [Lysinibacillus sp. FJAT-14222]QQP14391.1 LysR family transcriptional regulator [Lysinibacillus agricola]
METEWLRTFIVAAKTENFRETAEQLFITQSTVSKHIQHLEKELQTTLFERQGKHVKLNHIGAHFLQHAEKMLVTIDEGLQNTVSFLNGYTSQLTIGVAPQIANSTLPVIIHTFQQQNPSIQLTIELLRSNEIGEAVYAGKVDIGLSKLTSTRDIHTVLLAQEPLHLIAPISKRVTDAHTLLQQETILTHEYAPYWQDIQQVLQQFPSYKSMQINQTEVIKNFVKHGLGIAFLPKSVIEAESHQQLLHSFSVQEFSHIVSSTYFLAKYVSADIEAFLAICQSVYKGLALD